MINSPGVRNDTSFTKNPVDLILNSMLQCLHWRHFLQNHIKTSVTREWYLWQ